MKPAEPRLGLAALEGRIETPKITFIVPTKNSAQTLQSCLSSICAQRYPDLELIVVDNHSVDDTANIAHDLADQVLFRGPERSAQRNAGAMSSTGEVLVFLDSDMIAPAALAADIALAFSNNRGIQALVIPERSKGLGFWAACRILEKELYLGDSSIEAARAFRRSAFFECHGYDELLHAGEDWDLADRIRSSGGSVGRVESVVVHDEGRLSLRGDLSKKLYYGCSLSRYVRKQPKQAGRKVVRSAFLRGLPTLLRSPRHAIGLLFMKILEAGAVLVGMLTSLPSRRRRETPQDLYDGGSW